MASGPDAVFRQVRRLFGAGTVAGLPEGQLLERFLARGDEAAFEALVASLGPMVLGVCRRALRDPHDVEDAFQATFLILVRRGETLRDRDLLGPWLHRVAVRVAVRASAEARRRRSRVALDAGAIADRRAGPPAPDLRPAIDEELARLPEKYRAPVVLCDLEGRTHEEAARQLCWPVGTVKGRLSRARGLLRGRLARRGLAPSAGLLAAAWGGKARAAVPELLSAATTRAATALAAGRGLAAGMVPATAAALVQDVTRSLIMTKLKVLAASCLTIGLLATGAGVLARQEAGPRDLPPNPAVKTEPPGAPAGGPTVKIDPPDSGNVDGGAGGIEDQLDEASIKVEMLQMEVEGLKRSLLAQANTNTQTARALDNPTMGFGGGPAQSAEDRARSVEVSKEYLKRGQVAEVELKASFLEKSRQLRQEKRRVAELEARRARGSSKSADPAAPSQPKAGDRPPVAAAADDLFLRLEEARIQLEIVKEEAENAKLNWVNLAKSIAAMEQGLKDAGSGANITAYWNQPRAQVEQGLKNSRAAMKPIKQKYLEKTQQSRQLSAEITELERESDPSIHGKEGLGGLRQARSLRVTGIGAGGADGFGGGPGGMGMGAGMGMGGMGMGAGMGPGGMGMGAGMGMGGGFSGGGMGGGGRWPGSYANDSRPRRLETNSVIVTQPAEGDRVAAYSMETGTSRTFQLPPKTTAQPIVAEELVALYLKGEEIPQVAVYNARTGEWYPQALRASAKGQVVPVVGPAAAFYTVGRRVYAFGLAAAKWDVLELEEGAEPRPVMRPTSLIVEAKGRVHVFNDKLGRWDELDAKGQ